MKIAIKYNETVKIFNGDKTYLAISQFISKAFNLVPSQITLTYLDEEGDSITLASDSDLLSACEINNDKKFLKIRVALSNSEELLEKEEFEVMSDSPVVQESFTISSKKEEEATKDVQRDEPQCKKEKCEEKKVECSQNKRETSSSSEQGHHGRRRGFKHFMRKFDEKIAEKVDERIKSLLPCIKSQIEGGNPIKTFSVPNSLVHEGIECKGCLSKPIVGIRYKCMVCPIFNLCQVCEGSIEHEHNLLKMRKIENESEKNEECQGQFKGFWKHGHHGRGHHGFPGHHGFHGHHGFPGFPKPHWEHRDRPHHEGGFSHGKEGRVTRKLAMIFGGKPEDYNEFAKANENLRKFEVINKYAEEKGLNEKLINFRCERVASKLGKQPGEFVQYVKANMDLKPRDIIRKLIEQGKVQNPWKEGRWGGKGCHRWGDRQTRQAFLKEKSQRKEEKSSRRQSQRKSPLRGTSQEKKEKAIILDELMSLFGSSDLKNYFNIIEQHFSMGKQAIIQKVIDSKFLKKSA